jgi:hypothetical protein
VTPSSRLSVCSDETNSVGATATLRTSVSSGYVHRAGNGSYTLSGEVVVNLVSAKTYNDRGASHAASSGSYRPVAEPACPGVVEGRPTNSIITGARHE